MAEVSARRRCASGWTDGLVPFASGVRVPGLAKIDLWDLLALDGAGRCNDFLRGLQALRLSALVTEVVGPRTARGGWRALATPRLGSLAGDVR